ncbi:MAG: DUF6493 family protein, partial [Bacteroidota bacterium]
MDHAQRLTQRIDQQKEVVAFLQTVSWPERQQLLPTLKTLHEKYYERQPKIEKNTDGRQYQRWEFVHPQGHRDRIFQATVLCARTRKEFEEIVEPGNEHPLYSPLVVDYILPRFVPSWFTPVLNSLDQWARVPYLVLLDLAAKGHHQAAPEQLARALSVGLVKDRWLRQQNTADYRYDDLFRYPITLREHVWLLFEFETFVHDRYQGNIPELFGEQLPWAYTFVRLCEEGHLARLDVLRACLLTSTRSFNQAILGWFFRLFETVAPTLDELVQLQKELFISLQCPVSKPVTVALKQLKKLCQRADFQLDHFLATVPQLLQSTTKSTQQHTLMILQTLAKKQPTYRSQILACAVEALGIETSNVQTRAAKLIATYATSPDADLSEQLAVYRDSLYSEAQALLQPWLDVVPAVAMSNDYPEAAPSPLGEEQRVATYTTFDERLFFVSQVLDSETPVDAELVLPVLQALDQQLTAENVDKLGAVFKRALKMIWTYDEWRSKIKTTLAYFLNDYAEVLQRRFPDRLQERQAFMQAEKKRRFKYWSAIPTLTQRQRDERGFQFVDRFFVAVQKRLLVGSRLPQLSTPTHTPCWLDPQVLIERLRAWQVAEQEPDLLDWQVALMRLPLHAAAAPGLPKKWRQLADHPYKIVLGYLLGLGTLPHLADDYLAHLLPAVIARRDTAALEQLCEQHRKNLLPLYQDYTWVHTTTIREYEQYNFRKHQTETVATKDRKLSLVELEQQETGWSGWWNKAKRQLQRAGALPQADYGLLTHFYFGIRDTWNWFYLQDKDAERLLLFCPNHWPLYIAPVVANVLRTSLVTGEIDKRLLERSLDFLRQAWHRSEEHDVIYLFLAASMLCNHKTARELAGELWLSAVQYGQMDTPRLGYCLGRLLGEDYAPLKRFTDLLSQNLIRISPWHDQQVLDLLHAMLPEMPAQPVRNTKQWLTIFVELVLQHQVELSTAAKEQLSQ